MGIKMNFKEVRTKFKAFGKIFDEEAEQADEDATYEIFRETQVRVPKKTSRLADTGTVKKNASGRGTHSHSIWYGEPGEGNDPLVDYAAAVHEVLDAQHAPPTGAKFVEGPLLDGIDSFHEQVIEHAEKAVKKAFGS